MTATIPNYDLISREHACELTILGNGFFVVRDSSSDEHFATQAGHFNLDADGFLITGDGFRVQGLLAAGTNKIGDLQVRAANLPSAAEAETGVLYYAVDDCGRIKVHLTDCSSVLAGQILLQNFEDPRALVSEGHQLYSNLSEAGPLPRMAEPGREGLGAIHSGVLEAALTETSGWTR